MNKYDSLSQKSIFDFCDDPRVLSFITGEKQPSASEYLQGLDADKRLFDLHQLAFLFNDDRLAESAYKAMPIVIDWEEDVHKFAETLKKGGIPLIPS